MLMVVFVVLMVLWVAFGVYRYRGPDGRAELGGTLIPWVCVAILGWVVFAGAGVRWGP